MSVSTELTRIQGGKTSLKTSIEAKGVTVPSATLIDGYATLIDQITGGGSGNPILKSIDISAFSGTTFNNLTSYVTGITIPRIVTGFNSIPFNGLTNLVEVKVESGNTTFDTRDNCNAVIKTSTNQLVAGCKASTIPNTVTSIGANAFNGCTGLTSITIPSSVTSIGDAAFKSCSGLTGNLIIGNGVTTIGNQVFNNCSNITSVTIPSSLTRIGNQAFVNCNRLSKVIIPDIAAWCNVSLYAYNDASNPLYIAHHIYSDENTEIFNLVIPNTVTKINNFVFRDCYYLTSISIPNTVTEIGKDVFHNCRAITTLDIPDTVTSIGEGGIMECTSLQTLTIGSGITTLGPSVIRKDTALTSVTIKATTPPSLGSNNFADTNNCPIYVPAESVTAYQTASGWSTYASRIQAIPTP